MREGVCVCVWGDETLQGAVSSFLLWLVIPTGSVTEFSWNDSDVCVCVCNSDIWLTACKKGHY